MFSSRNCEVTEQERTEYWRMNVEKDLNFIIRYSRELSDRNENSALDFPLAEMFRLDSLPEDIGDKVDQARG